LAEVVAIASWGSRRAVDESLGQDREEETSSLSGTSLGTSHQIATTHDNRNRVFLDWSWHLVMGELDVSDQMIVKRRVGEPENGLRNVGTGSLDGDIVVFLEVDTSLLLGWVICNTEKLTLDTWVGRASNVLSITPLSITATACWSTTAAAATGSWVTISIAVESLGLAVVIPSTTTSSTRRATGTWATNAWSEFRSTSPVTTWTRCFAIKAVSAWGSTLAGHQ